MGGGFVELIKHQRTRDLLQELIITLDGVFDEKPEFAGKIILKSNLNRGGIASIEVDVNTRYKKHVDKNCKRC